MELFGADREWMNSIKNTPIAFNIMTTFQEGSERLAWQEMSKLSDARVHLILPYPEDEYEKEFSSERAKEEFRSLKKDPRLRSPFLLQKDSSDPHGARTHADRYIVDHCDVVFVIGEVQGQCKDFVDYAKAKERPMIFIQGAADIKFVQGFGLNRNSLERLEKYNRISIAASSIEKESDEVFGQVFGKSGERVAESVKEMIRKTLVPQYARASIVALRNQLYHKWSGFFVYAFSAIAVASVASGVIFGLHGAYAGEFVFLALILIAVLISERRGAHRNWIETRFLAERIRSSMYLAAAGVEVSPIYLPPFMGAAHRQDDWMVMAFHDIWERTPPMHGCSGEQCSSIADFICETWLDEQIEYHARKSHQSHRMSHLLEVTGYVLFGAALIMAGIHMTLPEEKGELHEQALVFAALWLPALAAALEGIRKHNEYSRLATLSENMEEGLKELRQRYGEIRSNESLDSLLRETDELMLRETQGWLMMMRFVKLEPVL